MDERPAGTRRLYDSTTRRARAAETHERIVRAGSELLHDASLRDWRSLTVRAVARRAGVNERTVYRHFGNERGLHDAIMRRFEEEAGIDLADMGLDGVASAATRIFDYVATFPRDHRPPSDPTLSDASQRQRQALEGAVTEGAPSWSRDERVEAAAALDVLWSLGTYERLVIDWQFDHDRAVRTVRWVIALVHRAVVEGRPAVGTPGTAPARTETTIGNGVTATGDGLVAETGEQAAAAE
jgi:AcrR family transcriptional regulator